MVGHTDQAKCKHCGESKAWNTSQWCKPHLNGPNSCEAYKKYCIENRIKRPEASNQKIQDFFSPKDKSSEQLFALAIYTSTANFSMFETPQWEDFFKRLKFDIPSRQRLSGDLLRSCYADVKDQVLAVAAAEEHIQIISDGSSNIAKIRVENVSFMAGGISYYWKSTGIGAIRAGSDWTLDHLKGQALEITMGNLKKWTAFSSDTNNTQRRCWELIARDAELAHVHNIPCESHGHQLSIKDILFPGKDRSHNQITSKISQFWKDGPMALVSYFRSSDKQLAFLRGVMSTCYGKIKNLVATVPTRWGTQCRQVESILDNQVALQGYAVLPHATDSWKPTLQSPLFWQDLRGLYNIIQSFHEQQKISESNNAGLRYVYPRWLKLNDHLQIYRQPGSTTWSQDIDDYCNREGLGGGMTESRSNYSLFTSSHTSLSLRIEGHN
jgi:hypothetical protein